MQSSDAIAAAAPSAAAEAPPARAALLQAVARWRQAPPTLQVRPGTVFSSVAFEGLHVEELQLCTETDASPSSQHSGISQAWVPLRLAKRQKQAGQQPQRLPVVLLLHATGCDKGTLVAQQAMFARRGYLAVTLDCRYHGERAGAGFANRNVYQQALVSAWRGSGEHPFLLDNVWDVQRTLDYLQQRPDVDASRIGMTGVSLGGMHTWLAAAADERIAVAAPMLGVQYFGWAVQHLQYHARVSSIPLVFQAASADVALQHAAAAAARQQSGTAGASGAGGDLTPEAVTAVWEVLLPGMLRQYDAPYSLPLMAPRPLLIANGELDPRCPMEGVELALEPARAAYAQLGASDQLQLYVEKGVGHECTEGMWRQVFAFMDRHLLQQLQ